MSSRACGCIVIIIIITIDTSHIQIITIGYRMLLYIIATIIVTTI